MSKQLRLSSSTSTRAHEPQSSQQHVARGTSEPREPSGQSARPRTPTYRRDRSDPSTTPPSLRNRSSAPRPSPLGSGTPVSRGSNSLAAPSDQRSQPRDLTSIRDETSESVGLPPTQTDSSATSLNVSELDAGLTMLLESSHGSSAGGSTISILANAQAACDALGRTFAASNEGGTAIDQKCCSACVSLADALDLLPVAVVVALPVPNLTNDANHAAHQAHASTPSANANRGQSRNSLIISSKNDSSHGSRSSSVKTHVVGVPAHRRTAAHVAMELRRAATTGHWSLMELLHKRLVIWLSDLARLAATKPQVHVPSNSRSSRSSNGSSSSSRTQAALDSLDPDVEVLLPARRQNTQAIKPLPLGAVFEYDTEIGGLFVQSVEKYPARGALPTDGRVKPGAVLSALDGNNLLDVPIEQIVQVMHAARTDCLAHTLRFTHAPVVWTATRRAQGGSVEDDNNNPVLLQSPGSPLPSLPRNINAPTSEAVAAPIAPLRSSSAVMDSVHALERIDAAPRSPVVKQRATANKFRQLRGANELREQQEVTATRGRRTIPSRS